MDTPVGGESFTQRTTYDQFSRVFQQFDASRLPDGNRNFEGVRYHYTNSGGYVTHLEEAAHGGGEGVDYRTIELMNARGEMTGETLGNGVMVARTYYGDSGRFEELYATGPTGVVQDWTYVWDTVGNLRYRHDAGSNHTRKIACRLVSKLTLPQMNLIRIYA